MTNQPTGSHTSDPAASRLASLRPFAWMLLGGFVALGAAAMLGNSGVQAPKTMPAIVTAESNAYLVTQDHRVFYLRGNAALEVVGLPNNWR